MNNNPKAFFFIALSWGKNALQNLVLSESHQKSEEWMHFLAFRVTITILIKGFCFSGILAESSKNSFRAGLFLNRIQGKFGDIRKYFWKQGNNLPYPYRFVNSPDFSPFSVANVWIFVRKDIKIFVCNNWTKFFSRLCRIGAPCNQAEIKWNSWRRNVYEYSKGKTCHSF